MRLNRHNGAADAGMNGRADKARLLADQLTNLHIVAGIHDRVGRRADVHRQRNNDRIGLGELLERQMLGVALVFGRMDAAVEAFVPSGTRFGDIRLDFFDLHCGIIAQLHGLVQKFLGTALLFQPLIDFLPRTVLFGIDLALAVLRAAALTVDEALGAVHDGADASRDVQVALRAGAAGLLRQRHAVVTHVVQRIGRGKRGDLLQVSHRLHAQSTGNDHDVLCFFGDNSGKLLLGLHLVAKEINVHRPGDVFALRFGKVHKTSALRLLCGFEFLEALVAGDDKEVILLCQQVFQLFFAL